MFFFVLYSRTLFFFFRKQLTQPPPQATVASRVYPTDSDMAVIVAPVLGFLFFVVMVGAAYYLYMRRRYPPNVFPLVETVPNVPY